MNSDDPGNLQELLSELLGVPASEIVETVQELKEVKLRLMDKLNTMNTKGDTSLWWVHEIFTQALTGHFKGR